MHPLHDIARLNVRSAATSLLFTKFSGLLESSLSTYRRWKHSENQVERIILACHPRGGSTWLGETLLALPRSTLVWEPFNPKWNPACLEAGFSWHNYWPSGLTDQQSEFARSVLRGHRIRTGHFGPLGNSCNRLLAMARARILMFKCTNANLMLHHLDDIVPSEVVVLLRHPCAVVSSQLAHGKWRDVTKDNPDVVEDVGRVIQDHPRWRSTWAACTTQEEVLAFIWGMRTALPLTRSKRSRWCVITYEGLVEQPDVEVDRLFEDLDHSPPKEIWNRIATPSTMTQSESNVATGKNPLETWTRRLSQGQVEQILDVVHDMGIHAYTEKLRPQNGRPSEHVENVQPSRD